ncbi:MAG: DNA repair protein RecO [Moheibacter sp.]
MFVNSPAIVLSSIKYGDSGRIIKFYTENFGVKSLISKSAYSKKNRQSALFLPLNQLELTLNEKSTKNLDYFREAKQTVHYTSIYSNPIKSSVVLFICEILNAVLQEEESSPLLFQFISTSLTNFDEKDTEYADFHLWFLMKLTRFLGFYPNITLDKNYFDLKNGVSVDEIPSDAYLSNEDFHLFKILYSLDSFEQHKNQFNQKQRKTLLSSLLSYYSFHISDFRHPKSLEVLNAVFK